jgi:LPXTG-motif cell wall-anchored protein
MLRIVRHLACAVALIASVTTAASAQQPLDRRTTFRFSGPVAMPGVTLPAGEYIFRLVDSGGRLVQVLSGDGTKSYAMFFSVPAERLAAAEKPEVRFMETAAGMAPAVKTWWYPGERRGYEFIYPKEQARRLAQGASQPVLTTQAQTTETAQTNSSELARVSAGGEEQNVSADEAPTPAAPSGSSQEGEIASPSIAISNAPVPSVGETKSSTATETPGYAPEIGRTRTSLPKTASNVALVAILGAAATGAGVGLWVRRRSVARV